MTEAAVIIIRAEPGASATAERVEQMGLLPLVSPALALELVSSVPDISFQGSAGLLFSSANGVRFFTAVSSVRDTVAWCVGPSTAAAAQQAGFAEVHNANGNSSDLAKLVSENADASGGHLIHIANTAAGDVLQSSLMQAGFDVRFVGLYTPIEAEGLSAESVMAAQSSKSICVLIHSAKGAASFAKLFASISDVQTTFICVSDKAAQPVSHLGETLVADRPNEDALLQKLRDWQLAL